MMNEAVKIYISGNVDGFPSKELKSQYQQAEWLLSDLGIEYVNPSTEIQLYEYNWNEYVTNSIGLLLQCNGILMLDNWRDCVVAGIEYDIAVRTKKYIWFETNVVHNHEIVLQIQNVIHEVMGLRFHQYTTKSRKCDVFFARMIFVYHCNKNNIEPMQYIRRERTMLYHYLNRYSDEVRYNPQFKKIANRVEEKLNNKTVK